eukprot:363634-Chlamydomonas_euryale.AAC.9
MAPRLQRSPPQPPTAARAGPGRERAGTASATAAAPPPAPPPLRLSANSEEICDSEFEQSLRMRGQLQYIHPAAMGPLANSARKKAASAGGSRRSLDAVAAESGAAPMGAAYAPVARVAAAPVPGPHSFDTSQGSSYDDGEDDGPAPAVPLSSVSVGLLRGAANSRKTNERRAARAAVQRTHTVEEASAGAVGEEVLRGDVRQS